MLVVKKETVELVNHQVEWFSTIPKIHKPQIRRIGTDRYSYKFVAGVPCRSPGTVFDFLSNHVWIQKSLHDSVLEYLEYLAALCLEHSITFNCDLLSLSLRSNSCVIHGDATLENFVQTEDQLVVIDPGVSRGYNSSDNDLGKICQSVLTHWEVIKYGVEPIRLDLVNFPITYQTISSLAGHWIRIIKNANRHHPRIERYGRQHVLPTLERALLANEGIRSSGLGWDTDRLETIYAALLPASISR